MEKAKRLNAENELLKETLERMRVVSADYNPYNERMQPSEMSDEEELRRIYYYEMMRRRAYEEQMQCPQMFDYRYSDSHSRGQPFKTPNAI